ncbi:MAG: 50S ribosomal protein L6 [Candidatus Woesearchaeota archaeon]
MKLKEIKESIKIPEKSSFLLEGNIIKISGPKGTVTKKVLDKNLIIEKNGEFVVVKSKKINKVGKRAVGTYASIIKNLFKGVCEGFEYKLKICSGHFPMNVSVSGKEIIIKNFLGEKYPRKCVVKGNVQLKLEKDVIVVSGIDKEEVGQAAADIEQTTRITNRDRRIFQDGIYIISKEK